MKRQRSEVNSSLCFLIKRCCMFKWIKEKLIISRYGCATPVFPWGHSVHHFPYFFILSCSVEQFTAEIPGLSSVGNHFSLSMLRLDEDTEF